MTFSERSSQREARQRILAQPATMLMWDMGSGKTYTVLSSLALIGAPTVIVATPKIVSLERTWEAESAAHGFPLTFARVHGTPKQRRAAAASDATCYVTTYDSLHTPEAQAVLARVSAAGGWLVLDETTHVKSFTRRFKALRKHLPGFSKRIGLTGTPVPKGMSDLFYQVQCLDLGERFGLNKQTWLNRNFYPTDRNGYNWAPLNPKAIEEQLSDLVHRCENADLPPVVADRLTVPLDAEQARCYKDMATARIVQFPDGSEVIAETAAVQSGKLRQITSGLLMSDGSARRLSKKRLTAVKEMISEINSPVIVTYEWIADAVMLLNELPGAEGLTDGGDVIERWNRGEVPVLVMHPKSGGHGLNLQFGGNHVIWYTAPWSVEMWKQLNARLARPGQLEDTVHAHVVTGDTAVDQRVMTVLRDRDATEQDLLDAMAAHTAAA